MEDLQIVNLFWERSEDAIAAASDKYGRYCRSVAYNVLSDDQDAQECVNDCLLRTWNSIPPARPESLKAYMGKITRNLALDRAERAGAAKRGGGELPLALDELSECIGAGADPGAALEASETAAAINAFLAGLEPLRRKVFVRRYWYMDPVADVAERFGLTVANTKTMLFRIRKDLAAHLRKEGIDI